LSDASDVCVETRELIMMLSSKATFCCGEAPAPCQVGFAASDEAELELSGAMERLLHLAQLCSGVIIRVHHGPLFGDA
jgi:hypothetical protein